MIVGPAGVRCKECAALRGTHLYQIAPARLLLSILVALVVGFAGSALLFYTGFFVFFIGPAFGGVMAQAVNWASGRKRGVVLDIIAIGGIIVGAAGILFVTGWWRMPMMIIWPTLGIVLAISACYARTRYL